jgi:hypothetical protein
MSFQRQDLNQQPWNDEPSVLPLYYLDTIVAPLQIVSPFLPHTMSYAMPFIFKLIFNFPNLPQNIKP